MGGLLAGKNGQVGFELQGALAPLDEVLAIDRHDCNLANLDAIQRLLTNVGPSVIVNPVAYTEWNAESELELTLAINGIAPGVLGGEALRRGALVVHYSMEYVFDGSKDGAYSENDLSKQQGAYGKTNLAGERGLTIATADYPLPADSSAKQFPARHQPPPPDFRAGITEVAKRTGSCLLQIL